MAKPPKAGSKTDFVETIKLIRETKKGQEAAMYGPLRDLFCDYLGYGRGQVLIDIAGEAGRPDVTCRAPSGINDRNGNPREVDWIVVEAKDEHDAFSNAGKRETIFAQKAKYIRPDTAWFVMVDPAIIVARPVMTAQLTATNDLQLKLTETTSETEFRQTFARLAYEVAGVPQRLKAFRDGDISLIATEKLSFTTSMSKREANQVALARRNFYETLRNTTGHLQESTLATLKAALMQAADVSQAWAAFAKRYPEAAFDPYTLTATARPTSYELSLSYGGDVARLNRKLKRAGSVARLALDGLPQFRSRVSTEDEAQAIEMFATETANLILARILLIRFFEDHGFFGPYRYLCNGGVEAFQKLRERFAFGYTRLLKMAYEKAQALYAAAFDETELDWVFATNDQNLSSAIEWAMYQLSRYDFTTVKGDILTGVYDRFLDRGQRKKFGEYYTPPSIARYIVDRLGLSAEDRFMDPACGSGTFLIERYQQVVGEEADRGLATYDQVQAALERLTGNDLNTFSAVLAQIQILWHVLGFRADIVASKEFPDIAISDKANSIVRPGVELAQHGRFIEFDQHNYGGIGGNPPYVRPERAGVIDDTTRKYFEAGYDRWPGISAEANIYALFIYRALDGWCRPPDRRGERAGKLGYVVPLAFCGTRENAELRKLFAPGGRWTITELIDLEVIWRHVFDADVLPIILIAEAREPRGPIDPQWLTPTASLPEDPILLARIRAARLQPKLEARLAAAAPAFKDGWRKLASRNLARWKADTVSIKLADKSCIDLGDGTKRPTFDLTNITPTTVEYGDLFTPDGRIITRLTPSRRKIIAKLQANPPLSKAFQEYWFKKSGDARGSVRLNEPSMDSFRWEHREMVSRGLVFAGRKAPSAKGKGHTIYKAENILAGEVYGEPQDVDVDIAKARNRYLFEYLEILPKKMWAVSMIATCPNAVAFDPRGVAFTDTATIFGPRSDLEAVPFDLLFISRVYRFFYVLVCRMSYLNMNRSHVYPTNLRLLPWSENIAAVANQIEAQRASLIAACRKYFDLEASLFDALDALPLKPFRVVVRDRLKISGEKVEWSESFLTAAEKIEVDAACKANLQGEKWHVQVSQYLLDWVDIPDEDAACGLALALEARAKCPTRNIRRHSGSAPSDG